MKKPYKARFKQSATKLQVAFAIRLLREVGLLRPSDELNLRAMRRDRISELINGLQKKRKAQPSKNEPSPLPNWSRDNASKTLALTQGETPKDVAGVPLQL